VLVQRISQRRPMSQQGVRVDAAAALEEDPVGCGWIGQFGVTVKLIRLNSPLRRTVQ
jgi:hypothetical protein